jgi:hypothetical protein
VTIAELARMLSVPGRKPGVTTTTIRTLIYRRFKNGLDAYVWRSAPTRWLIDVDGFLGWLRSGTEALDRKERAAIADFWRTLNESLHASENTSRTVISLTEARTKKQVKRASQKEDMCSF